MWKISAVLTCLACVDLGRRAHLLSEPIAEIQAHKSHFPFEPHEARNPREAFAKLLLGENQAVAFNPCNAQLPAILGIMASDLRSRICYGAPVMKKVGELTGYSNVPGDFSSRLFADPSESEKNDGSKDGSASVPRVQPKPEPARLLVLDTLLPGQRLRYEAPPAALRALANHSDEPLVVVGRNNFFLLARGVEVMAQNDGNDVVLETTGRLAELVGVISADKCKESRWAGQVSDVLWLGNLEEDDYALSLDDEYNQAKAIDHAGYVGLEEGPQRLAQLSEKLCTLVEEWMDLVQIKTPGRLDGILKELGPMPTGPNARAVYAAALMNWVPSLGVAIDIRPAIITATGTSRRMSLAEQGLVDSIQKLKESESSS